MLASVLSLALVAQDHTALRAAPRESAPQQVALWAGDSLEVRAEKGDYLQVWDHRRERGGYLRASAVRRVSLSAESAPEILAVLRFLRDLPGSETLGIAYGAAYLRAAPAEAIDAEVFDILGTLAERLARRATAGGDGKTAERAAAQLELVSAYGVAMRAFEQEGRMVFCYEGDAQRRVLALTATDLQKARAALALTRHDCVAPSLAPIERFEFDRWRAEVLDRVQVRKLPEVWANRVHMRRAGVWASLAHQLARRADAEAKVVADAGTRAVEELAAVNPGALQDEDQGAYSEAAIRVGASRWAAEAGAQAQGARPPDGLRVSLTPGRAGETCVALVDAKHDSVKALARRCTYGVVWPASATAHARGNVLTLAVQPLDTWRELWVFKKEAQNWTVEVLPPSAADPGLGYVEFAGWVAGKERFLAAREVKQGARYRRSFEVLSLASLATLRQADQAKSLSEFYRGQSAAWKARTVALR